MISLKIAPHDPADPAAKEMAARLIRDLLSTLPPPGADVAAATRVAWLSGAAALFDVLYGFDPMNPIKIVLADYSVSRN